VAGLRRLLEGGERVASAAAPAQEKRRPAKVFGRERRRRSPALDTEKNS